MRISFPKWTSSSKLGGSSSKAAAKAVDDTHGGKEVGDDDDDCASIGSSLSSRSSSGNDGAAAAATFENGLLVKPIDESILLRQAEESLRTALLLIDEAGDKRGSWVDARDLLDATAAALDDAGLALRSSRPAATPATASLDGSSSRRSGGSESRTSGKATRGSKKGGGKRNSSSTAGSGGDDEEAKVRKLADEVVDKRRSLLGDALVHDADGIWAKSVYGKGDGISFGAVADFMPMAVPEEEKDERALIVFASQTGTAKKFARHLHKKLGGGNGLRRSVCKSLRETSLRDLARYRRVYVVCSTFGIGRPPREGEVFYSALQLEAMRCSENHEDLDEGGCEEGKPLQGTSVAIAALGSSAFRDFAKFGFGLAEELSALGATMAQEVTTLDAASGKSAQKEAFRTWVDTIVRMEKERLEGWVPKELPKPSMSKAA